MLVASAQIKPKELQLEANMLNHIRMIDHAARHHVEMIVFPEMSLTGYERENAAEMAFQEDDPRLNLFIEKAIQFNMYIIVGAPIKLNHQLHIGSFIISPDGTVDIYTKQFLHEGEEEFFTASQTRNPVIEHDGEKISFAICADITNPLHPAQAHKNHTTLYVSSLFYTPNGIAEGHVQLSQHAKKHDMQVLMSNYIGKSYQLESAGESAYWDNKGERIVTMDCETEGLLIVNTKTNDYKIIEL